MSSFTITNPTTGDSLVRGDSINITWSASGLSGTSTITLQLRKGGSFDSTITTSGTNVDSGGSYTWTVPADLTVASDYTIRIFRTGNYTPTGETGNFRISGERVPVADATLFTESVSTAESTWSIVQTATDATQFTDSVATAESKWSFNQTASDATLFTESISTADSKWRHYYTIADVTAFSESITTATSKWQFSNTPSDATAFTESIDTFHLTNFPGVSDATTFTESVATALSIWTYVPSENISMSESVTTTVGQGSWFYQMDTASDHELYDTSRSSGWMTIGPLDKNSVIRDVNIKYKSSDAVNVKIYGDDNTSTALLDTDFAASSSMVEKNIRVGKRARLAMVKVSTPSSYNYDLEIEKLEIGVGG